MSGKVAGQARVKVGGQLLETAGDVTLDPGGIKREAVSGDHQAGAYRESTVEAKLEFSELVKGRTRFDDFADATVTIEFDTGQTWVMRNAWVMDPPQINAADGKAKRTVCGPPAEEVL